MPSWCENELLIAGPQDPLDHFHEASSTPSGGFTWTNIFPTPSPLEIVINPQTLTAQEKEALCEEYGTYLWYEWNTTHWGTKWGPERTSLDKRDGILIAGFETPWSPPTGVIDKFSQLYPKLTFLLSYKEEGVNMRRTYINRTRRNNEDSLDTDTRRGES
jgi:hypothetical protein